jgi:endonuclease/exonuclease/phosphatase (EEP) superfamily protein YafD
VVSSTTQQITVTCLLDGIFCTLTTVYAKTAIAGRRQLWQDLLAIHSTLVHGPWLVFGDFNCILGAHEKRGGSPPQCDLLSGLPTYVF